MMIVLAIIGWIIWLIGVVGQFDYKYRTILTIVGAIIQIYAISNL